jgi:bifunctional non-homologous end joining protein LigD
MRQEMVIGGYTDPEGSRSGLGALLLGVYEPDGTLRYSGKVGTGFNAASLVSLREKLDAIAQKTPAFSNPPRGAEARRAHWVQPKLVAEVAFTEWTEDGTLRHPSFQGLREDKKATDVVRERPANGASAESVEPAPAASRKKTGAGSPPAINEKPARARGRKDADVVAGIQLSNPDKPLYPDAGLTKRDLALYYEAVADWILPHLEQRPLSLVRCPNGWQKPCFYQKNADAGVDPAIDRVKVQTSDGPATYMMANSASATVALLQMGVLEIHPWGARAGRLGFPDRIVFDFDPDDELRWQSIVEAVHIIRTLFEKIGLQGFVKTTGGKGLHVVVPIEPTLRWPSIKNFSKAIAELFVRTFPDRFTAKISKATRHGRIFVDYLRNDEGSTAISAYSTRARANAPVATPVAWEELAKEIRFDHFNVRNVPARLKRMKKDPWADFFKVRQTVTKSMMQQVGYVASDD